MSILIPVFPETVGDSVEFTKDGHEYRLRKEADDLWVIHAKYIAAEEFQLEISNRKNGLMDVIGRGHLGTINAHGASEYILFDKLF